MNNSVYHAVILTDAPSSVSIKPQGAYAIANFLRIHGYNVLVIEHLSNIPKDRLFKILAESISENTFFVGYSSTFFGVVNRRDNQTSETNLCLPIPFVYFDTINSYIKELNTDIKIVYGGTNGKIMVDNQITKGFTFNIDYVIFGFAEKMILDFVENIKNHKVQNTSNIINGVGIIDYDKKGEHFSFKSTKHIWNDSDLILTKEPLTLEVARGCVFKCKFCAYPLIGKHIKDDSYIRTEDILLEEVLENYEKFQTTNYLIADDTFNERTDKIELLLRVRDKSKLNLTFAGYNRIDLIARKPEQISLLNELNFNGMFFGIESMNHNAAKYIGKGCKPEEITDTLFKLKHEFGKKLITTGGFIIGLPHDTPYTVEEWTRVILQKDYPLDSYMFNPLSMTSNSNTVSEFSREREKYGFQKLNNNHYSWKNDIWDNQICTKLANRYNSEATALNKRIKSFTAIGLTKYGYSWEDISNMSPNDINGDFILINQQEYISKYLTRLDNLLGI